MSVWLCEEAFAAVIAREDKHLSSEDVALVARRLTSSLSLFPRLAASERACLAAQAALAEVAGLPRPLVALVAGYVPLDWTARLCRGVAALWRAGGPDAHGWRSGLLAGYLEVVRGSDLVFVVQCLVDDAGYAAQADLVDSARYMCGPSAVQTEHGTAVSLRHLIECSCALDATDCADALLARMQMQYRPLPLWEETCRALAECSDRDWVRRQFAALGYRAVPVDRLWRMALVRNAHRPPTSPITTIQTLPVQMRGLGHRRKRP